MSAPSQPQVRPTPTRIPLAAALALTLINVLWAGSAIAAKIALGESGEMLPGKLGPFTLAFARFAPSALLLTLLVRARGERIAIRREDYRAFFVIGTLGLAITYGIFYGGVRGTTATEATLLIATEPILVALMARLFLGERLRTLQWLGMLAGFVGVYLIVNRGLRVSVSPSVSANALVAFALCFEAYATIIAKRLTGLYSGLVIVTTEMWVGSAALLPFAAGELLRHPTAAPAPAVLFAIAYLSLVCAFVCYAVWFSLLKRFDVSAMAGFLFIQPTMGPVFGYLHGERVGAWTAAGAALVIVGVWLVAVVGGRRSAS